MPDTMQKRVTRHEARSLRPQSDGWNGGGEGETLVAQHSYYQCAPLLPWAPYTQALPPVVSIFSNTSPPLGAFSP